MVKILKSFTITAAHEIYKKEKEALTSMHAKEKEKLASKHAKEIELLASKHAAEVLLIHQDHEQQLRQEREKIETRQDVLLKMDEKELLAHVMLALDGYSGRFERIEKQLTADQIVDQVSQSFQELSAELAQTTASIKDQIDKTKMSIESSIYDSDFIAKVNSMESDMDNIKDDITSLRSTVAELHSCITDMYSYDSLASTIGALRTAVDDIQSTVNEIHSSVTDKYSYDSLASAIDSLRSAVDDAKSAIESHY